MNKVYIELSRELSLDLWEIYLVCLLISLKMSSAQHSRAAINAFLRGDHYSAQELSRKAHPEWMTVESLNFKAVQEI
ncbi:hypothetical protein MKX03_035868 [Papaver bracteatum]|nr:hypothetical protein MKX03_035868 [Papaver bracteatum]